MNQNLSVDKKLRRQDQLQDDQTDYKEYEEGDVTGFMAEKPIQSSGMNSFDVNHVRFTFLARTRSSVDERNLNR